MGISRSYGDPDGFLLLHDYPDYTNDPIQALEHEVRELRERCVNMHNLLLEVLEELHMERASKRLVHILTELEDTLLP